ncbi:MAG: serine--tRNA ligase, partial [Planctomycetes bacterium]|nr:serine--tRNA ligase [Planctomycetota bacterium]
MLDLKYIRENPDLVKKNCADRRAACDVDKVLALAERRSALITKAEEIRHKQKDQGKKGPLSPEERERLKGEGKALKDALASLEEELKAAEAELDAEVRRIPNLTHPDAPVGFEESDSRELRRRGEPTAFAFPSKDHLELGKLHDLIDFDAGTRVSGRAFYYLKREGALLEFALLRYALDLLVREGFVPVVTPDLAKFEILEGIGFVPRGPETQIYAVEGTDLGLIATAEITLGGLRAGEILSAKELPLLLGGVSHCFRTEAGAHGRVAKGLYRVHQFSKVEMFAFTTPETSDATLERFVGIEERIFSDLEVPYRVLDICSGDLGGPAYRKYDLEAWMPGRGDKGEWGEVTSTSNCTDYQARRLKIRYRPEGDKGTRFVHTLNGTAVAASRAIIAILENHQQADGSILIPKALRP